MIRSFVGRDAERLFFRESIRRFPPGLLRVMRRKLIILNAAVSLQDLRIPPGNRLKKLRGKRSSQFNIPVNNQWRICFRWAEGNAHDVEIADYHQE